MTGRANLLAWALVAAALALAATTLRGESPERASIILTAAQMDALAIGFRQMGELIDAQDEAIRQLRAKAAAKGCL